MSSQPVRLYQGELEEEEEQEEQEQEEQEQEQKITVIHIALFSDLHNYPLQNSPTFSTLIGGKKSKVTCSRK